MFHERNKYIFGTFASYFISLEDSKKNSTFLAE